MRRIVVLPLLVAVGLLAGCSQVTQLAGEAVGVPVEEICTTFDDAYGQYQTLIDQGDATEEQIESARDGLVANLEGIADDLGGQVGDLIRENAQRLAETTDLQAPETVEAIEQVKDSVSTLCG